MTVRPEQLDQIVSGRAVFFSCIGKIHPMHEKTLREDAHCDEQ